MNIFNDGITKLFPHSATITNYKILVSKTIKTATVLIVFMFMASFNLSHAGESAGRLIFAEGEVLYSTDGGRGWVPAEVMMDFAEGTYVKVGEIGQAALLLPDRSQIRLRARSVLQLKKAGSAPGEGDKKQGVLSVLKGNLWFRNKRRGPKPLFETPTVTMAIRGTEISVSVENGGRTDAAVLEGTLKCENVFGVAVIERGQAVSVRHGGAPEIVKLLVPENSVQWLLLTPEIAGPADLAISDANALQGIRTAQSAMRLLISGKRDAALDEARKASDMASGCTAPHVALATVLQSMGRFDEALKEGIKAAELDPASVTAMVRVVELLMGLDRVDDAQTYLDRFENREDARIDLLYGYIALSKLDACGAEAAFQKSIAKRQDLASAYLGLGLALYRLGRSDEALANMEKACLLEPLAAYPHYYLGKAQYELGERNEAEVEIRRAAVLDPHDPTPHLYLSVMLTDRHRPGEGVLALEKALALNDNRLATRSRYLLDQDRATKNVSLAFSLSRMGLYQWAKARGDMAVWDDPSNSGAYLFRAVEAVALNQIDPATLGDVTRARLLQPVNANTYATYSDYQSLLEMPDVEGTLTLEGGTDDTGAAAANIRGGGERLAFYAEGAYDSTDGPFDGTGEWGRRLYARAKGVLHSGHELLLDIKTGVEDFEDKGPWQDGRLDPRETDTDSDYYSGSLGYHWRQGVGRDLLLYVQAHKNDLNQYLRELSSWSHPVIIANRWDLYDKNYDNKTWRFEAAELFRLGSHRMSFGGAFENVSATNDTEFRIEYDNPTLVGSSIGPWKTEEDTEETRFYAGDIWFINDSLSIDYGLAWCRLADVWRDSGGNSKDKNDFLPHLGLAWKIGQKDVLRLAGFEDFQPNYLSGALQASQIAGFEKITGAPYGTKADFYGIGWDRQWNERTFTRLEIFHQEREYPDVFIPHPEVSGWREENQNGIGVSIERLITPQWALAFAFNARHVRASDPVRKRWDYDGTACLTWAHPDGWRCQAALWYLNQDEGGGYDDALDNDIFISSLSVEKSLWEKRGLIFAKLQNISGERFGYLAVDELESRQLPWQDTLFTVGVQWNFW